MGNRKTTLRDIAIKCGFSVNTVSRVMRDDPNISNQTKMIIRKVASELGYIKNSSASTMSSGRSNTVAIIVNDIQNPHLGRLTNEMEKQLQKFGYDAMLFCMQNDVEKGKQKVNAAISHSVDGILYFPFIRDEEIIKYIETNRIPYVLLDRWIQGISADTARCDDELGGYQVGEHLISLGHREFLYIGGPEVNSSHWDRLNGFLRAVDHYGINRQNVRLVDWEKMAEALVTNGIMNLLQPMDYTAIVAFNDELAYHVLNTLHGKRIRVPDDISLVGFDHLCGFLKYLPSLTSVGESGGSVARTAVDTLIYRIENPDTEKKNSVLPVRVFDEGTTAVPRKKRESTASKRFVV